MTALRSHPVFRSRRLTTEGTGVQVEVKPTPEPAVDPYRRKPGDSPAVGDWRGRMATEDAKELYKERAATAECVNPPSERPRASFSALLFAAPAAQAWARAIVLSTEHPANPPLS